MNKNGNKNTRDIYLISRVLALALAGVAGGMVLGGVGKEFSDLFKRPEVQFLVGVNIVGGLVGFDKSNYVNIIVLSVLFVLCIQYLQKKYPPNKPDETD